MSIGVMVRVIKLSDVVGADYVLLLMLAEHAQETGICWPSVDRLRVFCHLRSRSSIQAGIRRLEAGDHVHTLVGGGGNRSSIYWLPRYADPDAVADWLTQKDARFDDIRSWVRGLLDAEVATLPDSSPVNRASAPETSPEDKTASSPVDRASLPDSSPVGTLQQPGRPGINRKKPPTNNMNRKNEPGTGVLRGLAVRGSWGGLEEAIGAEFGGLSTRNSSTGGVLAWVGQSIDILAKATDNDRPGALALWREFCDSDAREFVLNPRNLPGQLGSWVGRQTRRDGAYSEFVHR